MRILLRHQWRTGQKLTFFSYPRDGGGYTSRRSHTLVFKAYSSSTNVVKKSSSGGIMNKPLMEDWVVLKRKYFSWRPVLYRLILEMHRSAIFKERPILILTLGAVITYSLLNRLALQVICFHSFNILFSTCDSKTLWSCNFSESKLN